MRCSRLILIFGMIFCFSFITVRYESFILRSVLRQKERMDRAAETAADAATENLRLGLYEEDAIETAAMVFDRVYAAVTEEEGCGLKRISVSLNGTGVDSKTLTDKTRKGDELTVCFELMPREILVPGRRLEYEKIIVRTLTLD